MYLQRPDIPTVAFVDLELLHSSEFVAFVACSYQSAALHRAIEERIMENHTHPLTRTNAYKYELRPCPEMRKLVLRVQQLYDLNIVYD